MSEAPGLCGSLTKALLGGFFHDLLVWVANGAASLVGVLGNVLSASTEPVLSGSAFRSEFDVMAVLSAGVALPLLAVGAIQAIIRQEPGGLLRSALVRLPLALLFTGVSVQLVALGLAATDQASAMVLGAAGDPTHRLLLGLVAGLEQTGGPGLAAFGAFLVVLTAAIVAFVLWLELAVRSAAIAAASLFLPLALVGLAWPATSHWARRLGETLAALVLSKLVIASVLALAAGLFGSSSGVAGVVEGVALLAVAAFAPFALLKLVPAVEAGAVAHLEGLGQRPVRAGRAPGYGDRRSGDRRSRGPRRPCSARLQGRGQRGCRRFEPADRRPRRCGSRSPRTGHGAGGSRGSPDRFGPRRFRPHRPLGLGPVPGRFFCHDPTSPVRPTPRPQPDRRRQPASVAVPPVPATRLSDAATEQQSPAGRMLLSQGDQQHG